MSGGYLELVAFAESILLPPRYHRQEIIPAGNRNHEEMSAGEENEHGRAEKVKHPRILIPAEQ